LEVPGLYNRRDAWLVVEAVHSDDWPNPKKKIIGILNDFPGTSRRMEEILPGLFSDYAHTPEKIVGG
jgi:UDP-N-acetylmuramate--alanine ligase